MGHLITVQNLLLAIGGNVYFNRISPAPELDPFAFKLEPLSLPALAKYVTTESALPDQLPPTIRQRAEVAFGVAQLAVNGSATSGINHVGVLYARLYWLFQPDETPQGPWMLPPGMFPDRHLQAGDFVPDPGTQADPNETQGTSSTTHNDGNVYVSMIDGLNAALTSINHIAVEGEGFLETTEKNSHFERFLAMFEEYPSHLETGGEPVLPIPTDPGVSDVPLTDPIAERNRLTHFSAVWWARLFNARYQMLIAELWSAMSLPRSNPKRGIILNHSIATEMKRGVRDVARRLVTLPRRAQAGGVETVKLAGPPFEIPQNGWPADLPALRTFIKDRIADAGVAMSRLESADNPIPLTTTDRSLFSALRAADTALASAIDP